MRITINQLCTFLLLFLFLSACASKDNKTTIEIEDNHRHYYPILTGQELNIKFEIKNTGKHPFILSDIFTSCGCVVIKNSSINTIPAGKSGFLILRYDSSKNIGYVKHYVTLYGNFATTNMKEIVFDVNVVPNASYTKDYEELYKEKNQKEGGLKGLVDGDESQKGYYLDSDMEHGH